MGHELAYLALRHTLLTGRVLRSTDPTGLQQEMCGRDHLSDARGMG